MLQEGMDWDQVRAAEATAMWGVLHTVRLAFRIVYGMNAESDDFSMKVAAIQKLLEQKGANVAAGKRTAARVTDILIQTGLLSNPKDLPNPDEQA